MVFRVALHPEGVDRNFDSIVMVSLSSVALHPEGVDRNSSAATRVVNERSRPPPGGRG